MATNSGDSDCSARIADRGLSMIGKTVSHYQIIEKLGQGAMGEVFLAQDSALDRKVALKFLPDAFTADPERLARFEREARLLASLNHPNIVTIHDVASHAGGKCIVMEYITGKSLAHEIEAQEVPLQEALRYATQIADALAAAHDAGIIHRDLKPANIMVTTTGQVKVLDFGVAKPSAVAVGEETETAAIASTRAGFVVGTAAYMSPEQVRGRPLDRRSDIFSLGLILYEMFVGNRAFGGDSQIEVMNAILKETPAELPDRVPPALRLIVAVCLEKNPANRFESARDIAFALRALSSGSGSIRALPKTEISSPRRGRLALPYYAALAGSIILAAVFAALYFARRPEPLDLSAYKYTPFAVEAAYETNGVWSPDGTSITYLKQVNGLLQLMVRSLDSPSPTQLTSLAGGINRIEYWSPDRSRIYFLRGYALWSVSSAGGEPLQELSAARAATLSPDGNTLAFVREVAENGKQMKYVWISSPPGAEPRKYLPAPFASDVIRVPNYLQFSPDGSSIAYAEYSATGVDFWLLDWPDGTNAGPHRVLQEGHFTSPPAFAWLPDSRHIVMSVAESLWLADVRTGALKRITASIGSSEALPSISPDGTRIVVDTPSFDYNIVELPLDGSSPYPFLATAGDEQYPSRPLSGDQTVFVTNRSGGSEIWLRNAPGNWERPLVTSKDFPGQERTTFDRAAISPDGLKIAFRALPQRKGYISLASGGHPVEIMPGSGQLAGSVSWSPDSKSLACVVLTAGSISLAIVQVGSDKPPDYIAAESLITAPAWSPDGRWIAYGTSEQEGSLVLVSPDGKISRRLPTPVRPATQRYVLAWSRDASTIYIASSIAGQARLDAVEVQSGKSRKMADYGSDLDFRTPSNSGLSGSLSADSKTFAATILISKSNLWIVEGFPKR
jgi:serine/threonine protein kinase